MASLPTINVDQGWISIEDQFPAHRQRVLVWCSPRMPGVTTGVCSISKFILVGGQPTWDVEQTPLFRLRTVTHWRPLPQGPDA